MTGARDGKEKRGASHEEHVARQQDAPSVEAVGDASGQERETDHRQKPSKADKPQVHGSVRRVVHLLRHREEEHLERGGHQEPIAKVPTEIARRERGKRGKQEPLRSLHHDRHRRRA